MATLQKAAEKAKSDEGSGWTVHRGHVSEHDCAALALGLSTVHVGACQRGGG